jgi:hypothetical protein
VDNTYGSRNRVLVVVQGHGKNRLLRFRGELSHDSKGTAKFTKENFSHPLWKNEVGFAIEKQLKPDDSEDDDSRSDSDHSDDDDNKLFGNDKIDDPVGPDTIQR